MRLNWNTKVVGERVRLHPYRRAYVAKYHEWMCDPVLCELTASEPQTLECEYELQAEWREDNQKLTFIMFDEHSPADGSMREGSVEGMIGDINMFLLDEDHADDYLHTVGMTVTPEAERVAFPFRTRVAEIMVMVAEPAARKKGYATEALACMLKYAMDHLKIQVVVAKISDSNISSIRLFEKLGFVKSKELKPFQEVHYVMSPVKLEAFTGALTAYAEFATDDAEGSE